MTNTEKDPAEELADMWRSPKLINTDAINNMDLETLEKVAAILDKI